MLEKTLAMLAEVRPGSYLPDDVECYDPAELEAFGRLLSRLLYSPSSLRRLLQQKFGVTITRADVYGEIPTIAELERSFASRSLLTLDGIFPDNARDGGGAGAADEGLARVRSAADQQPGG